MYMYTHKQACSLWHVCNHTHLGSSPPHTLYYDIVHVVPPPPDDLSVRALSPESLIVTWEAGTSVNCSAIIYEVSASNCGSCSPLMTRDRNITCRSPVAGQVCNVTIRSMLECDIYTYSSPLEGSLDNLLHNVHVMRNLFRGPTCIYSLQGKLNQGGQIGVSLVPRSHPLRGKRGLVNLDQFLGLASSVGTHCRCCTALDLIGQ